MHAWYHIGGARRDRTADLLRARQALSQLSYGPIDADCPTIPEVSKCGKLPELFRLVDRRSEAYCNMRTAGIGQPGQFWWVWEDSNFRPHPYQGCALTN